VGAVTRLLLDTCTFIWLVADPERISETVAAAIDAEGGELYLSDASAWEICLKWEAGKIKLPRPPRSWIEEQAAQWLLIELPIRRSHLYRVTELPVHHRDPFDRLLVAQALEAGLTIATPDPQIRRYPVPVLW
jgi:PIN domain nuclease of toxin-antitoxin system